MAELDQVGEDTARKNLWRSSVGERKVPLVEDWLKKERPLAMPKTPKARGVRFVGSGSGLRQHL